LVELLFLLGLVCLAVRLDSFGSILYRARRMGRFGKPFEMLKFRSMRIGDPSGAITAPGDSRITRVGAWLRVLKLDELPQLYNVLKGDMSLVGPRPEDIEIVERYFTSDHRRILDVRPGLTCITQVKNFPDMTGEVPPGVDADAYYVEHQLPRRLALDLEYVERACLRLDLELLAQTAYCVLVESWFVLGRSSSRRLGREIDRPHDKAVP